MMTLSIRRSQSAPADITQTQYNENVYILFWTISCPHLDSWQVRNNLTDEPRKKNIKYTQYVILPSLSPSYPLFIHNSSFYCSQIVSWMSLSSSLLDCMFRGDINHKLIFHCHFCSLENFLLVSLLAQHSLAYPIWYQDHLWNS